MYITTTYKHLTHNQRQDLAAIKQRISDLEHTYHTKLALPLTVSESLLLLPLFNILVLAWSIQITRRMFILAPSPALKSRSYAILILCGVLGFIPIVNILIMRKVKPATACFNVMVRGLEEAENAFAAHRGPPLKTPAAFVTNKGVLLKNPTVFVAEPTASEGGESLFGEYMVYTRQDRIEYWRRKNGGEDLAQSEHSTITVESRASTL